MKWRLTTLIGVLLILTAGCISEPPPEVDIEEYLDLKNPLELTPAILERGGKLYEVNCLQCHGPRGMGDGHQATMFNPRPTNLQDEKVMENPDGALFYQITFGVSGTGMPAFRGLTDEDRWHLVSYLRSLKNNNDY